MIWIVSTCKEKLSELEFVNPVKHIAENFDRVKLLKHYEKPTRGKVIITGTALKDFEYMKRIENFAWIKHYRDDILGICSGAQILAKLFGLKLVPAKKIGVFEVVAGNKKRRAYFLTSYLAEKGKYTIALVDGLSAAFKIDNKYGVFFHPEVLNVDIIEKFLSLRNEFLF